MRKCIQQLVAQLSHLFRYFFVNVPNTVFFLMGAVKDCLHRGADDICTCMLMSVIISCQLLGRIVNKYCHSSYPATLIYLPAVYEFEEGLILQVLVCLRFQALARTNHQLAFHLAGCFIYPIIFTARCIWFFTINAAGHTTFSKVLKFLILHGVLETRNPCRRFFLQNQVLLLSVIMLYIQGDVFNDFFISHEVALKLPLSVLNTTCIGLGILLILYVKMT